MNQQNTAPGKIIKRIATFDRRFSWLLVVLLSGILTSLACWLLISARSSTPLLRTCVGHEDSVSCVNFAPDGKLFVTGSEDRTVRLWEVETSKERLVLRGHTDEIKAVVFSPDGKLLASAGGDGCIRIWEIGTNRDPRLLSRQACGPSISKPLSILALAFSPDGRLLASGGADKQVCLFEIETGNEIGVLPHSENVLSLIITPDGSTLISRTEDGVVRVWDLESNKMLRQFGKNRMRDDIYTLILAPDGKRLACNGTCVNKIELWDWTAGILRSTLTAEMMFQDSYITNMFFSQDGKVVGGTTMFGNWMVLWDANTGGFIRSFHFVPRTTALAVSPDGKCLVSTHVEGGVNIWDLDRLITGK